MLTKFDALRPLIVSYTCEIWNFTYRARGLGMGQISTQLAIFFNVFVNPIALENIQWKYYVVYVVLLVIITATVYFFYPETIGHSLEEMAKVFDGDTAAVADELKIQEEVQNREENGTDPKSSVSHTEKAM
jgi:hypothetical protein